MQILFWSFILTSWRLGYSLDNYYYGSTELRSTPAIISSYNLLEYSQIHIAKVSSKPLNKACVKDGVSYKCSRVDESLYGKKSQDIQRAVLNDEMWKLVFGNTTRGIDIVVNFHRPYLIENILLAFAEANNIAAGYIEIKEVSGLLQRTNFAVSKWICEIFFDPELDVCHVRNITWALKYLYEKAITGTALTIHLFPPIVTSYTPKPLFIVSHFKVFGQCYCSNGRTSKCVEATEDDTYRNDGQKSILLCSTDVRLLPFKACSCSSIGTLYSICSPIVGLGNQCPCKQNYRGLTCNKCSDGYFGYPTCTGCFCNFIGSKKPECNVNTGRCECESKYVGMKCDQCAPGRYNFPFCYPCPCPVERTKDNVCDPVTGQCHCARKYQGGKCESCAKWLQNFPICHKPGCKCDNVGSFNSTCNDNRQCYCMEKYTGSRCDECLPQFGGFPTCTACECNLVGSYNNICDPKTGQCHCKPSFKGRHCNECQQTGLVFPQCTGDVKCECSPAGTKFDAKKKGPCIAGVSCICKDNMEGEDCSRCRKKHYGLSIMNPKGCDACQCSKTGSFGKLGTCNNSTGQCYCKESVMGKRCEKCRSGYRSMNRWNLFGCTACNCDVGGSTGPDCDDLGHCTCKPNFEGKTCNRLREGQSYVLDYHHIMFEMESASSNGKPVVSRYNTAEFSNFTGDGYVSFGNSQTNTKLKIEVPETRKYILLIHYVLRQKQKATVLVYFSSQDRSSSYVAAIDLLQNRGNIPSYAPIKLSGGKKEIVLSKGAWELDLSSTSSELLVDHVVLIPEEYYTAKKLQPNAVKPCLAGQPKETLCVMYKYIDLTSYQIVQAESGTNSKGYGSELVVKTRLFNDPDLLQQLPVLNEMAELSPNQIALTLQIKVTKKDIYRLVVTYFNPDDRTYRLDLYDGESGTHGHFEAIPCLYRFLCRAVVLQSDDIPYSVKYEVNRTIDITFLGNIRGNLAIDYVAFVPSSEWSPDIIIPRELCHTKDKSCLQNLQFQTPDDARRIHPSAANPLNPLTKAVYTVANKPVYFTGTLQKTGKYVLVYQYYQPNWPRFSVTINVFNNNTDKPNRHDVPFCPANVGCRGMIDYGMVASGDVTISFTIPDRKELWIDSVYFIPEDSYRQHDYITPKRIELTSKFKRSCIDANGLPLRSPPAGFCTDALITLTSEFTRKTFVCACNQRGSLHQQCNRIGGDCQCRPNVIGKNCDKCRKGYYGFPYCKACNCFIAGSESADCDRYGRCTCKARYTGRTCSRCKSGHWGFPDCQSCDCDRRGSFTLMCRSNDGQCPCLRNYGSRACNKCQVGHYDFPYCRSCNCHSAGIVVTKERPTGCYRNDTDRCDCKQNVEGSSCGRCKEHYYNMRLDNPLGCTACNCSTFGTIRGAGPCHIKTGQCICQPNVIGKQCDGCKDGFYVTKTDKVFSCQPCLCSTGGSVHGVCDKVTGQCKCKPHVGGLKCDREINGGFYLPSIGQFVFAADDLVPNAPREFFGDFDGGKVNSSFASRRVSINVTKEEESFYIMVYYSLITQNSPRIDLEFSKEIKGKGFIPVTHHLKAREPEVPTLDIVKKNGTYYMMNLTKGIWGVQLIMFHTFVLNQITLVPAEQISQQRVSKYINNPCTILDGKRYCSMYTYFKLDNVGAHIIQGEEISNDGGDLLDLNKYKGANIDGAVSITKERDLIYTRQIDMKDDFHVIIQYINIDTNSSLVDFSIKSGDDIINGTMKLFPCIYAFACRQVVLSTGNQKVTFPAGKYDRTISFRVLNQYKAYIDFITFIPKSKWNPNLISPSFYCNRRLSRCIDGTFPSAKGMANLEATKAMHVTPSTPPDGHPATQAILMTTRRQRNLRWIAPLKANTYYMMVHYYQPLHDSFLAKIIVMTFQRAKAGKIEFKFCPSVHGCRAIVKYLLDDNNQKFSITGNILRTSFSLPYSKQLWVKRISLVPVVEYTDEMLEVSPLDITRRYLRKCIGRQSNQIEMSNREFCRSATFELTLGLNKYPEPCVCNARGSAPFVDCNPLNGQCSCKQGFRGKDCSMCVQGLFPHCKAKSRMFRYSYFLRR